MRKPLRFFMFAKQRRRYEQRCMLLDAAMGLRFLMANDTLRELALALSDMSDADMLAAARVLRRIALRGT